MAPAAWARQVLFVAAFFVRSAAAARQARFLAAASLFCAAVCKRQLEEHIHSPSLQNLRNGYKSSKGRGTGRSGSPARPLRHLPGACAGRSACSRMCRSFFSRARLPPQRRLPARRGAPKRLRFLPERHQVPLPKMCAAVLFFLRRRARPFGGLPAKLCKAAPCRAAQRAPPVAAQANAAPFSVPKSARADQNDRQRKR